MIKSEKKNNTSDINSKKSRTSKNKTMSILHYIIVHYYEEKKMKTIS